MLSLLMNHNVGVGRDGLLRVLLLSTRLCTVHLHIIVTTLFAFLFLFIFVLAVFKVNFFVVSFFLLLICDWSSSVLCALHGSIFTLGRRALCFNSLFCLFLLLFLCTVLIAVGNTCVGLRLIGRKLCGRGLFGVPTLISRWNHVIRRK